jgi:hypothetical protein
LAFPSVGQDAYKRLQTDNSVYDFHGPWLYKIKGELHHITGTLLLSPGQTPMYSQLYIHDPDTALNHCMANRNNTTLDRGTEQILQDMLYRCHPSVQLFKQAYEITKDLPEDQDYTIALKFDSACDKRFYNLPSAASREIAVVIPGSDEEHRDVHDIVLCREGGSLKRINEMSPLHQSLHFVLLFPTGQFGWNPKLELTLGTKMMLLMRTIVLSSWNLVKSLLLKVKWWLSGRSANTCLRLSILPIVFILTTMNTTTSSRLAVSSRSILWIHGLLQSNHA